MRRMVGTDPSGPARPRTNPRVGPLRLVVFGLLGGALLSAAGCGQSEDDRRFINVGTAPVGGTFYTVGGAISEVVNNNRGELEMRVSAESTGGSMENIRLLSDDRMQFAMSNSSITYHAVRGDGDWQEPHRVRAVMTLFPNIAMFVAPADSGVEQISDLKGKRVYIGPEGAGFEYFVEPILAAHGLNLDDIEPRYGSQQNAVDLVGDGAVSAAMIGGGVPTPAITQLAQAMNLRLIPYDEAAKEQLIREYEFFEPAVIPGGTYAGIEEDFHGLNVGSAHLIAHADVDDQLVYDFVRLAYENREQIAERHRAARAITPENVVKNTGTPFHPGAIRYFQEAGIWPEDRQAASAGTAAGESASTEKAAGEGASGEEDSAGNAASADGSAGTGTAASDDAASAVAAGDDAVGDDSADSQPAEDGAASEQGAAESAPAAGTSAAQ